MLDCEITIPGDGRGRYGHPKNDVTRKIRDLLIDNNVYYIAVTNHLKICDVCSIEECLRVYLARRIPTATSKKSVNGMVSASLVKRALILENLAKKKEKPVPKELVNEFIWRYPSAIHEGNDPVSPWHRLSTREKFKSIELLIQLAHNPFRYVDPSRKTDQAIIKIAISYKNREIAESELESLIETAEVIYS